MNGVRADAETRLRREEIYRARVVVPVLAATALAWVAFLVFTLRADAAVWPFLVTFGAGTAVSALFARSGAVRSATVLLLVVTSHPAAALIDHYGVASPAGATLLLTIVGYGLLVGRSSLAVWTLVCCAIVLFLAWGADPPAPKPWAEAAVWCGLYVAGAWLTGLLARGFEGLIQVSRGQAQSLFRLLEAGDPADGGRPAGERSLEVIAAEFGARRVELWTLEDGLLVRTHRHPRGEESLPERRKLPDGWDRLATAGVMSPTELAADGDGWADPTGGARLLARLGPAARPGGVLVIEREPVRRFDRDERDLALALAQQTALVLQLARAASRERDAAINGDRQRIAREIHDGLAQGFTGVVAQLNAADEVLAVDSTLARTHLERARGLARASLVEARRSVWALRPAALARDDLPGALDRLARELTEGTGIEVSTESRGMAVPLPAEVEAELLRVGQEALTNAVRHAAPRRLSVTVERLPDVVRLVVRDDGSGLVPGAATANGFGTAAMRERVARLGGSLRFTSGAGPGTEVAVEVPADARGRT